jgi:coenzyme Q-binding protein COQ10
MTSLQTSKLVGHPWSDLFNLVLDVTSYPEFMPHCREVRILSRTAQDPEMTIIISRMTVGFSVFEVGYANRTTGDAIARRIDVEALDGPLRYLRAQWRFEPRGEAQTELRFSVDYEFSNPLLGGVASRVFAAMFGKILNAFEQRAARLFGSGRAAGAAQHGSAAQRRLTTN